MTINIERELTKGFAAHLIRVKARQLTRRPEFSKSDRPDLEQEMKLDLLERFPKFDPDVAHWNVFVTTVVERHVATILEHKAAGKRCDDRDTESLNALACDCDGNRVQRAQLIDVRDRDRMTCENTRSAEELSDQRIDVATLLATLDPEMRDICERLKTRTVSDVARDLNIPRQTLADRLAGLRDALEEAGVAEQFLLDC